MGDFAVLHDATAAPYMFNVGCSLLHVRLYYVKKSQNLNFFENGLSSLPMASIYEM